MIIYIGYNNANQTNIINEVDVEGFLIFLFHLFRIMFLFVISFKHQKYFSLFYYEQNNYLSLLEIT